MATNKETTKVIEIPKTSDSQMVEVLKGLQAQNEALLKQIQNISNGNNSNNNVKIELSDEAKNAKQAEAAKLVKEKQTDLVNKLKKSPMTTFTASPLLEEHFGKYYTFSWNCLNFTIEFGKTVKIPTMLRDKFEEKLTTMSKSSQYVDENIKI